MGRVVKWGAVSLLLLVVGSVSAIWAVNLWKNRRVVLTEAAGISLGDQYKDVVFRKGEPTQTCLTADKKFREIAYKANKQIYFVVFDEKDKVTKIDLFSETLGFLRQAIISTYDDEASILEKWGKADRIIEVSANSRGYVFNDYNLMVSLHNNKATGVSVFDKDSGFFTEGKIFDFSTCSDATGKEVNPFLIFG